MAADLAQAHAAAPARVRLRPLVQPAEHGVYGLFAEAVLLGLILAPSLAGALLALAGAASVVAQQPATLGLADLRRGRRYPRTDLALRIAAFLGTAALVALALAAVVAAQSYWWVPLALALLPAGTQFALDRAHRGKTALGQASGAVALGALAPAIALAPARAGAAALAIGSAIGWAAGLLGRLPVVVATGIAARSMWCLRPAAQAVHPVRIGITEIVIGLLWVAALAVGIVR